MICSFRAPVSKRVAEESDEESETDDEIQDDKESRNRFFKRSDSTLVLGKYFFLLPLIFILELHAMCMKLISLQNRVVSCEQTHQM